MRDQEFIPHYGEPEAYTLNHLRVVLVDRQLKLYCRGEFLQTLNSNKEFVRVETDTDSSEEADIAVSHVPHLRRYRIDVIANPEAYDPAMRAHRDVKFIYY